MTHDAPHGTPDDPRSDPRSASRRPTLPAGQQPTLADIGRLLACVNALHTAAAFAKVSELAGRVAELLDADGAMVHVVVDEQWVTVGWTTGEATREAGSVVTDRTGGEAASRSTSTLKSGPAAAGVSIQSAIGPADAFDPDSAAIADGLRGLRLPATIPLDDGQDVVRLPPAVDADGVARPAVLHSVYQQAARRRRSRHGGPTPSTVVTPCSPICSTRPSPGRSSRPSLTVACRRGRRRCWN